MCNLSKCPACEGSEFVKYGVNKSGTKKVKCKHCFKVFTINSKIKRMSKDVENNVIKLYLERMGIRAIARYLEYSHVAIIECIKRCAKRIKAEMPPPEPSHRAEADEIHSRFQKKKLRLDLADVVSHYG